jgi:hypothetical protein
MALLSTPVEKAQQRVADIDERIVAIESERAPDLDFDRNFALGEELERLKRMRALAVIAVHTAEALQERAAADKEKAADLAQIEAYRRVANREMPSRFKKIAKLQKMLAAELAFTDSHVKEANRINALARKHRLPSVIDGETLFRTTPVRFVPAVFEEREVWNDGAGGSPAVFRKLASGELVPNQGGYMKATERVEVSPEQRVGGTLPGGRLATSVHLMDLNGRTIWPAA